MQTREQRYATTIYQQANDFKQTMLKEHGSEIKAKPEIDQYVSMAHQLPVLVRTVGLAQALTFIEARGSKNQKLLLDHLAEVTGKSPRSELAKAAREDDLPAYMRLTQQVMAALVWYKRFAQSVLDVAQDNAAPHAATPDSAAPAAATASNP
jgi:CRISPR-associated protein Cmr5